MYSVQFWPRFTQLFKNDSNFDNLCENSVKYGVDNKIDILVTRQNKIPAIINCSNHTQYIFNEKKYENRKIYYSTSNNTIVALNVNID